MNTKSRKRTHYILNELGIGIAGLSQLIFVCALLSLFSKSPIPIYWVAISAACAGLGIWLVIKNGQSEQKYSQDTIEKDITDLDNEVAKIDTALESEIIKEQSRN